MVAENQGDGGTKAADVGLSVHGNAKDTAADESKTSGVAEGASAGTFLSGRQLLGWSCFHCTGNISKNSDWSAGLNLVSGLKNY